MNLVQLREILGDIRNDLDQTGIEATLGQVQSALQDVVNSPTDTNHQTRLAQSLEKLKENTKKSPSNTLGPVWRHYVDEFALGYVLPPEIERATESIIQRNQITPAVAVQEIQKLRNSIVEARSKIMALIDGLDFLGVKEPSIQPEKAAVGMLIPRPAIDDNLKEFGTEAHLLNRWLNAISEALTGHPENVLIQSVSSSDILIYVLVACAIAESFGKAVSKLLECYEKIQMIQMHRDALREIGVKKNELAPLEGHAKELMGSCIAKVTKDIMAKSKLTDAARKAEVETLLQKSFWNIAKRVDEGYNFDVRASSEAAASDDKAVQDAAATINKVREGLQYVNISGERILELPSGLDEDDSNSDARKPAGGETA
jgi:hypothetical protein